MGRIGFYAECGATRVQHRSEIAMQVDVNGTRLWFDVDGGRRVVIHGAGHFAWLDAPDRVFSEIAEFVASLA